MNPYLLRLVDGTAFFAGLGILAAAAVLLPRPAGRAARTGLTIVMLAAAGLVVCSATPLPIAAYLFWLAALAAAVIALHARTPPRPRTLGRILPAGLLLTACLLLLALEWPYHASPRIPVARGERIYVIGDSVSAGIGTGERTWPSVLGDLAGVRVVNLARGGASVLTALPQAESIAQEAALVILEIGGNDVLSGVDGATFHADLDRLLGYLGRRRHRLVMFELPLPPFRNALGRAQRQLAARHGVTLIPRRCLTRVLGLAGGTLDGLHLSQTGHDALAGLVRDLLEIRPP